ncbi:MAG: purine-nucleoside phosphorylase, partial [Calditrichae bacterium]|nr:purine-nucleoside phosphorylase [Calditrichia bacterium]
MSTVENTIEKELEESLTTIRKYSDQKPRVGLILGSGLGDFADTLDNLTKIPTAEIPHYPKSTVEGHKGNLVFGELKDIPVLAVQGRTHFYEGHTIDRVAYVV